MAHLERARAQYTRYILSILRGMPVPPWALELSAKNRHHRYRIRSSSSNTTTSINNPCTHSLPRNIALSRRIRLRRSWGLG